MKPYPSIETVYVRDQQTHRLDFDRVRLPEVDAIAGWTISEKIDGTNVRVIVTLDDIEVRGRTDKASLPPGLRDAVLGALPSHGDLIAYFTEYRGRELPETWSVTFYGEGYGAGIQKGGGYSEVKRFRVFDLVLGESWWTDDGEMRRICDQLRIPTAPHLGWESSLPNCRADLDAIFLGTGSVVAQEDRGAIGIQPEGIVAKPTVVLLDRHGDRVVWKLTYREFPAVKEEAA